MVAVFITGAVISHCPDDAVDEWPRRCSLIALTMTAASTSETSVKFYQTTRSNNPEDSRLLKR
jgi:hypothetical protein